MNWSNSQYLLQPMYPGNLILIGLLITCLLGSCDHQLDSHLADIDAIIESRPDSALMLIDDYKLTSNSSSADSAYYGMLLTHARYKNFIDETNDSLISASADYFLQHGYKMLASRSLFLQGMIQMNANRLGEAVVSFSQGLDIAKDSKLYMWEGQCARGLSMIYSQLYDGSSQLKYAKQAHDAFSMTDDEGWKSYSKLEIARGYNDNCQYEKSLSILNGLTDEDISSTDALLFSELLQLKGLSLFALEKYPESLDSYNSAFEINPSVLTENDKRNIRIAYYETFRDSVTSKFKRLLDEVHIETVTNDAFLVLARQDKYKEAFENLEKYKNKQDSVLSLIYKNNVAESLSQYNIMRETLIEEKVRNERLFYWLIIIAFIALVVIVYWITRERIFREKTMRLKIEADLESLRSDLQFQLENTGKDTGYITKDITCQKNIDFIKIIRQRYAEINSLCDDYYQNHLTKKANEDVVTEINNIVKNFTEKSGLKKIIEYVDDTSGGIYSSFKSDFFDMSEENKRLFLFLMLGFSSRTISVILSLDIAAIYNKKSRLKGKILKCDTSKKVDYLSFF